LTTHEADKVSFFASRDDSGTRLVAIIVNRDPVFEVNASIRFDGCGRRTYRRVFEYGSHSERLIERDSQPGDVNSSVRLEPYSFAVLEIGIEPGPAHPE
jgi:hypothetical protein